MYGFYLLSYCELIQSLAKCRYMYMFSGIFFSLHICSVLSMHRKSIYSREGTRTHPKFFVAIFICLFKALERFNSMCDDWRVYFFSLSLPFYCILSEFSSGCACFVILCICKRMRRSLPDSHFVIFCCAIESYVLFGYFFPFKPLPIVCALKLIQTRCTYILEKKKKSK